MAQYRQFGARDYDLYHSNGVPDHVSVGIRSNQQQQQHKASRHRRLARSDKTRRISITAVGFILSLGLFITLLAYYYLSRDNRDINTYQDQDDDLRSDLDFLTNVTRTEATKVLGFGKGSVAHGRDSRYWDRDDRRRDEDYNEDMVVQAKGSIDDKSNGRNHVSSNVKNEKKMFSSNISQKGVGLYNEAGRNELKLYEAEYEASLKNSGLSRKENGNNNQLSDDDGAGGRQHETVDGDDDYDGIDSHDVMDEQGDYLDRSMVNSGTKDNKAESDKNFEAGSKAQDVAEVADKLYKSTKVGESLDFQNSNDLKVNSRQATGQATKKSRSDSKRKKRRSCEMKLLNSTAQLVEPLESRKFSRFSLQYVEREEKPDGQAEWGPRFAGHQDLQEHEKSFLAHDKKIKCGFIKGPEGTPSTGFDLTEDDENYISRCHIAVVSCIFGNSDRLRIPATKTISKLSRKYVCFVMFVDDVTLQTLNSEGHMMDTMGFISFWKIVVVKNLPYNDMRRVGKIPKFLSHRLFPSARYSIWLDSKLRLQMDPLLILEYFLWRKGHEYAISNHYDRHCVWEEVAQNKKLNKYNHSVIDEQFRFYQADGLKRFNPLDPLKLLPSNVPEGSFIVRAHTPMSNLFSCLWFNEIDRFTPRDQLSFAYTYQKLRRMNPGKPFHLNMFRDCERRKIAKLFHHRLQERRMDTHQREAG